MRKKFLLIALVSMMMSLCIPACGQQTQSDSILTADIIAKVKPYVKSLETVFDRYVIEIGDISEETIPRRSGGEQYTERTYKVREGITFKELVFSLPGLKKNKLGRLITEEEGKTVRTILFNYQLVLNRNPRHEFYTKRSKLEIFPFSVSENRDLNYTADTKLYNGTVYVKIKDRPKSQYPIPGADLIIEYYPNVSYDAIGGNSDYVDLGLSVKWATRNVDAAKPEEMGGLYMWGETVVKPGIEGSLTYKFRDGYGGYNKYNGTDGKIVLDLEDDVAHVKLGGSWRMPTTDEIKEFMENCTWIWASVNGQIGYLVTSNIPGYTDRSIFLPYFFFGSSGDMDYWSGSLSPNSPGGGGSVSINVYEDYIEMGSSTRTWELPVRPVCK